MPDGPGGRDPCLPLPADRVPHPLFVRAGGHAWISHHGPDHALVREDAVGRRLAWAAADLGANNRQTLRHIVLPLIAPAIIAGALLSVTLSIDEFVVTFFTIGPQLTLPLYIITQIKFGVTPEVNALATLILVVTLTVFGVGSVL